MKNQFKLLALALALVAATSFSANAAETTTANLISTVTIQGQCAFSQSTYNVAVNGLVNTSPEVSTSISYNCVSGLSPILSTINQSTTDGSGNTFIGAVFSDGGFNTPISETPLNLAADGTDITIPLWLKFAKQGGGTISTPGTYVFNFPLTITY